MNFQDLKLAAAQRRHLGVAFSAERIAAEGANVAIILDTEEKEILKPFLSLKEKLSAEGKKVRILICREKAATNAISENPSFCREDISWNGKIRNPEALAFLKTKFQVLICFAASENKTAAFVVSVAAADLKFGLLSGEKEQDLHDVAICQPQPDAEVFVEEIKKYIKILNRRAV